MKLIGSESLSGREHFACGCGFPFQEGAFRMQLWISFPGGDISHAAVDSLSWGSISHAAVDFLSRRGHFACGCVHERHCAKCYWLRIAKTIGTLKTSYRD